ncbi:acetyl-CoA carboxylase biotin carboxyl carrier protein [Brevibacillus sp. BC25]|uniref:acetyl-CoA carboxylase biotin carboxyl carrier protein n=1 Tax=Brevibacillus sp. BC25 TaxID=1144308 RepID=UPI0002711AC7|nr:acetyl-CoA carboxylase biotin carboxyl carrier protein [Brevibacillus sp. BC25]EJL23373.1 acetyl-CoA carboxylase, biotin carboxyl carrier protein [Brevibacillus sp. BC25]
MLTIYELRELVKLLEQTDIESFEVNDEDSSLRIKRRNGNQVTAVHQTPVQIKSAPIVTAVPVVSLPKKETIERPVEKVSVETPHQKSVEVTENLYKITSPMVGTFYAAPAVDAAPYVSVNDRVEPTTIVCIVEAMKLFNEIEAEVKGEIVQVLVENGQLVEHGQPLFLVKQA